MTGLRNDESGFSLIELLIALFIFAIVSVAMFQVMFSARDGSTHATNVVRTSEEARLGFNRMVRDTRQADKIIAPSSTSFRIQTDFDDDGVILASPTDPSGSYEDLTLTFNVSSTGNGTITANIPGGTPEVLMRGVDCVRKSDNTCFDVFSYTSSRLEWDTLPTPNGDGVTSAAELDAVAGLGNNNSVLDGQELQFIDGVTFFLRVIKGKSSATFYAEAELRNGR
jgi:prepilin-type N-terminal cleavage/methylation domain-containing protein